MMNSVNGERFLGEPQPGCRAAGNCYDPNHGTNGKGTPVVVWDSERAKELQDKVRDQSKKPDPAPKPDSSVLLTEQHFLTRGACGSFHIITIAEGEMVGPIGAFKGQPIDYSFVDGSGTPEYYTLSADQVKANQSDTNQVKVKPVQATKLRNGRFQTNHIGPTGHMFFKAVGGPVKLSLERTGCT